MLVPLCAVLVLYVIQTFLGSALAVTNPAMRDREVLLDNLGGRDAQPEPVTLQARAQRAQLNLQESLFVFLPLSVIAVVQGVEGLAVVGGWVFLGSRLLYVGAYLGAVPFLRSALWLGGVIGYLLVGYAVVSHAGWLG